MRPNCATGVTATRTLAIAERCCIGATTNAECCTGAKAAAEAAKKARMRMAIIVR